MREVQHERLDLELAGDVRVLHSTLFLGTAWFLTSRFRLGAQARETMWKMALVGGVVTASLPAIGPLGTFTLRWPAAEAVVEVSRSSCR
jgi:hypothetical protein